MNGLSIVVVAISIFMLADTSMIVLTLVFTSIIN